MIVSVSRRTDIPWFYADWFFHRVRQGMALVRNPMNGRQVRRVALSPDAVDGFVFWSKNPAPMLERLAEIAAYPYYFQFTLTPYGPQIEPGVPEKGEIVDTFRRLSDRIGPHRVIWRYDPVLIGAGYTAARHVDDFARYAARLCGHTERATISFLDLYAKIARRMEAMGIRPPSEAEKEMLAEGFSRAAAQNGLALSTCAEQADLSRHGIGHAQCVDADLLARISEKALRAKKDENQRPACGCAKSVDIGAYHCCPAGCAYCYANESGARVAASRARHDPLSPFLIGGAAPNGEAAGKP